MSNYNDYYNGDMHVCCTTVFAQYPDFFKVEHVKEGMKSYLNEVGLSDNITEPLFNWKNWQAEILD